MMYVFFKTWTYSPRSTKVSLTKYVSYDNNLMSQVRSWYSGGKAVQFNFFKPKVYTVDNEKEFKNLVRIYVIVLVVVITHTKDSFLSN